MIFARIAKDFAQLADRCVQTIVEVDESICRPELLVKRLAAYQLSLLLQQSNQHLEGFLLQMKLSTAFPQFACFRVGFKWTKAKGAGKLAEKRHDTCWAMAWKSYLFRKLAIKPG